MPKFIEPMLSDDSSGLAAREAEMRSSTDMCMPPPVVMLMIASVLCLIRGRKSMNTDGSPVGLPSPGSRAWRCRIAAPASAAPIACSAMSAGVTGRWGDMVGVWIAPVTAQEMITLSLPATAPHERIIPYSSNTATARVHPPDASLILTGKHTTVNPVAGNWSRFPIFSIWQ